MRTNIIIDDAQKTKWWEIKQEAANLNMKIGDYLIFCHEFRKKNKEKEALLKILETPLSGGEKRIDTIKASKSMWKI
jgi:hypothetical protein